jgi:hypothetical protein
VAHWRECGTDVLVSYSIEDRTLFEGGACRSHTECCMFEVEMHLGEQIGHLEVYTNREKFVRRGPLSASGLALWYTGVKRLRYQADGVTALSLS